MNRLCAFFAAVSLIAFTPLTAFAQAPSFGDRLDTFDYPYDVQIFEFESQGERLEMAYMHLPASSDKPTALLLHGKNFNGAYWETTAGFLRQQAWGVVIPDQIGFGKSSKPEEYQYSFNQLAHNTRGLLKELKIDKVVVIGHSMGGMLASRFALAYPEMVSRVVLVNPIGLEDYLDYTTYPTIDENFERGKKQTEKDIIEYQKKNYYDGKWNAEFEKWTVPLRGWLNGPDDEKMALISALTYDMVLTQPVIDDFDEMSVPFALILGTRDRSGPNRGNMKKGVTYELGRYDKLGQRTMERLPKGEGVAEQTLIELNDLGHLPHIENFGRFKGALSKALKIKPAADTGPDVGIK